jgi:hypothetical protein
MIFSVSHHSNKMK